MTEEGQTDYGVPLFLLLRLRRCWRNTLLCPIAHGNDNGYCRRTRRRLLLYCLKCRDDCLQCCIIGCLQCLYLGDNIVHVFIFIFVTFMVPEAAGEVALHFVFHSHGSRMRVRQRQYQGLPRTVGRLMVQRVAKRYRQNRPRASRMSLI